MESGKRDRVSGFWKPKSKYEVERIEEENGRGVVGSSS
jgi:hypothetical protein